MNREEYQSRNATSSAGLIGKEELTVGNVLHPPVSDLDEHTSRSAATGIADGPCFGLPRTKNLGAAPGGTVATDGWLLLADAPGATDDSESVDPGGGRRPGPSRLRQGRRPIHRYPSLVLGNVRFALNPTSGSVAPRAQRRGRWG